MHLKTPPTMSEDNRCVGHEARAEQIRQMFNQIAPGYDARNRLFSFDRDRAWRRRAAEQANLHPGETALDLCTGTGKLAHELLSFIRPGGRVIGVDFSEAMLQRARKLEPEVEFRLGDVSRLNEPDASIDAITIGFGLRNLVDREQALREMRRVLRPGRRLVILEFAPPPSGPLIRYLAETVQGFPEPAELTASLARLGFAVTVEPLTFGIVMLHVAVRRD